jgi:NAD-dependent SIR2 family protein deacetylase
LKHLISQNIDGLHVKSDFAQEKLSELHGNTTKETCKRCKKQYFRDFRCRTAKNVYDHRTGRKCDDLKCNGELLDSIINFGENLPEKELNDGFEESGKADLCLAMGSSLTVTPAADMPLLVAKNKKKLVIVNL